MSRSIYVSDSALESRKAALRSRLETRARRIKDRMPDPIRIVAAHTAEALGETTFPSKNAIGLAVAAMRFDFSQIYATGSKAYKILEESDPAKARRFYAAWKRGDISTARDVIRSSGTSISGIEIGKALDPSIRDRYRDKNGRVICKAPVQLVHSGEYQAALKVAIAEIGKTASGWFSCAQKLGGDGNNVPWKGTAVHGSSGGSVAYQQDEFGARVVLTNKMPLAKKHLSPGQIARIRESARAELLQLLRQSVTAA